MNRQPESGTEEPEYSVEQTLEKAGSDRQLDLNASGIVLAVDKTTRMDKFIDRASEWFSSLLVKETRQALKSRQFLWTFFGVLILVAAWSVFAISLFTYRGEEQYLGPSLLSGFWVLLGFPLSIVIPYSTFRSLAHEFEDGTIQLVSITTMRPYQIVLGKLGSAGLQIMIYVSVLAPCIAFTYLLRGVDIRLITMCMIIAVVGSICLCCVGLFMASSTRNRTMGVAASILLLAGLVFVFVMWLTFSINAVWSPNDFILMFSAQGEVVLGAIFGVVITTSLVMVTAASTQLSFFADNRVTAVRIALIIQQTVFVGWCLAVFSLAAPPEAFAILSGVAAAYWFLVGSAVVSTSPQISVRVQRSLPRTGFGRTFWSLFMPGPGRGYLFVLCNIWALGLTWLVIAFFGASFMMLVPDEPMMPSGYSISNLSPNDLVTILASVIVNCLYATIFVSAVFLIIHKLHRRWQAFSPGYGLAIGLALFFAATIGSLVLHFNLMDFSADYSELLIGNWMWTIVEVADSNGSFGPGVAGVIMILAVVAGLLTLPSIIVASKDLRFTPQAAPGRVIQDDEERKPVPVATDDDETIDEIFAAPRESKDEG